VSDGAGVGDDPIRRAVDHLYHVVQQEIGDRVKAETGEALSAASEQVATAERNRERFRYALYVFLQERDGPAGKGAPTPETLALIRDVLQ
jgi:hypothetical protein